MHYEREGDYADRRRRRRRRRSRLSDGELRGRRRGARAVRALNKLGEYKWRYRVVDEGGSPRDEAIAVLEEAREIIAAAIERSRSRGRRLRGGAGRAELIATLHGLAVARLIFNGDDAEDGTISALLDEALSLRQATLEPRRRGRRDVQLDGDAAPEAAT